MVCKLSYYLFFDNEFALRKCQKQFFNSNRMKLIRIFSQTNWLTRWPFKLIKQWMLLFGRMSAKSKCIEPNTTFFSSNIIVSQPWNGSIIPLQMVSSIFRTNKRKMRRFSHYSTQFQVLFCMQFHATTKKTCQRHSGTKRRENQPKRENWEKVNSNWRVYFHNTKALHLKRFYFSLHDVLCRNLFSYMYLMVVWAASF